MAHLIAEVVMLPSVKSVMSLTNGRFLAKLSCTGYSEWKQAKDSVREIQNAVGLFVSNFAEVVP